MLEVLEKISQKLEAGEKVDPEHLEKIVEFLQVFADKCHHGKEEDLLFVALEEAGIPKEHGPIGVMLHEHDLGRKYIRGLKEAVDKYKNGDQSAVPAIIENARGYITLLKQHIEKEDTVLYVMANTALSEATDQKLLEEFDRLEYERIGAGKHEEFHKLIDKLSDIYLGE